MSNNKNVKEHEKGAHVLSYDDLGITAPEQRVSEKQFAIYVRVLLQNWRQGTVSVLGRADVNKTNKKPWKQKGTGRARAGSARSPLWRGGGVIFGPQERSRVLTITKNVKRKVLASIVADFVEHKKIVVLDWDAAISKPKTSVAYDQLLKAGFNTGKNLLFVSPDDMITYASFRNIPTMNIALFDQANAYDLALADRWIILKKDMDLFRDMVKKWQ